MLLHVSKIWRLPPRAHALRCLSSPNRLPPDTPHLLQMISSPSRADNIAVVDPQKQKTYTYKDLCVASLRLADAMKHQNNGKDVTCVASYNNPGANYVITALAAWHLGACLVPLCVAHTSKEIEYYVTDSCSDILVHELDGDYGVQHLNINKFCINESDIWRPSTTPLPPELDFRKPLPTESALILYTSGTSGAPKGCVHTQDSLSHMIGSLMKAWEYSPSDRILHFLPLHHLHGVLNKLWCMLYAGGVVEFMQSADPTSIWRRLAASTSSSDFLTPPSIFMAVPTVYARLLDVANYSRTNKVNDSNADELSVSDVHAAVNCVRKMRVTISGSAALPDPVMESWKALTGHELLERYGMSEIGMGLSNPLRGCRVSGTVGLPLPFIQCRLVDENEKDVYGANDSGELRVKGPTLFQRYLNKERESSEAFDDKGWFKTGDVAIREVLPDEYSDVRYRILGRSSTDIIKSGGYKLSALEIERELLSHPQVAEAAIVGKEDDVFGEIVTAVVVLRDDYIHPKKSEDAFVSSIKRFLRPRLAKYKQPRQYHIVKSIPRNLMGKVNKKTLLKELDL